MTSGEPTEPGQRPRLTIVGQGVDDGYGFQADADDLADQADDVLGIVVAVGVAGDAAALVGADLVLIDDPFQGTAVAQAVFQGGGRDAGATSWRL
jgi:hypothetical protein